MFLHINRNPLINVFKWLLLTNCELFAPQNIKNKYICGSFTIFSHWEISFYAITFNLCQIDTKNRVKYEFEIAKMNVKWFKFGIFKTIIFPGAFLFLWWRLKIFKPLLRLLSGILRMTNAHIFDQIGYLLLQLFMDCSSCFKLCFFFHMQKILCVPFKRESIFTSWIKVIS